MSDTPETRKKSRKPGTFLPGNRASVGNKGGGRKPDEFKRIMAELASKEDTLAYFQKVLRRDDDSDEFLILQTGVQVPIKVDAETWLKFWREATRQGYGEKLEVTVNDSFSELLNAARARSKK